MHTYTRASLIYYRSYGEFFPSAIKSSEWQIATTNIYIKISLWTILSHHLIHVITCIVKLIRFVPTDCFAMVHACQKKHCLMDEDDYYFDDDDDDNRHDVHPCQ